MIPSANCTFIVTGTNPLFTHGAPNLVDQVGGVRPDVYVGRCDAGAWEAPYDIGYLPVVIR